MYHESLGGNDRKVLLQHLYFQNKHETMTMRVDMIICHDVFAMNQAQGRASLRGIAEKVVAKYSQSLTDEIDGSVCGSGFD